MNSSESIDVTVRVICHMSELSVTKIRDRGRRRTPLRCGRAAGWTMNSQVERGTGDLVVRAVAAIMAAVVG